MVYDTCLRFTDKAEADEFIESFEPHFSTCFAIIGTLYEPMPEGADPETYEPVPLAGWHVNASTQHEPDHQRLSQCDYIVIPTNQRVGWLGR